MATLFRLMLAAVAIIVYASAQDDFEMFNGRMIRRTQVSDPKTKFWDDAMDFCNQFDANPFIPKTEADYQLYKEVRYSLGNGTTRRMWLPANDRLEEGVLRWYNGEVATNISLWDWPGQNRDMELHMNSDRYDCLHYGISSVDGPYFVTMMICTAWPSYPPICEKN